jgi:TonB family protein
MRRLLALATLLLFALGASPTVMAYGPPCKGTKVQYKGKCRYPDEIKKLKAKARKQKAKAKARKEKAKTRKEKAKTRKQNAKKEERLSVVVTTGRVSVSGGALDRAIIKKHITRQKGSVVYCYKKAVQSTPDLEGEVIVRFTISPTGKVMRPGIKKSSLGSSSAESCIVSRLARWRFPAPKNGGAVAVSYPFVFRVKGAKIKRGGFCKKRDISGVVRRRAAHIRGCYEQRLQQNPSLQGKVTVQWTISTSGNVSSANVVGDTLGDRAATNCMLRVIRRMRFPKPQGGICKVQWPFVFNAGG